MATTTTWKDASGARQERTEWHDVVAWEKLAQICGEYLHKGKMVYVEGSLQTRSWEDQNGQKRYKTEVKASNVVMLSPRVDGAARGAVASTKEKEVSEVAEAPAYDDEVPFKPSPSLRDWTWLTPPARGSSKGTRPRAWSRRCAPAPAACASSLDYLGRLRTPRTLVPVPLEIVLWAEDRF